MATLDNTLLEDRTYYLVFSEGAKFEKGAYIQRICFEDIEEILLSNPMTVCEEGMMRECSAVGQRQ